MDDADTEYVLVTEYFHPESASTGQLMTDLAVGLQARGLDVTVWTGQPNYHSGTVERQPRESTHEGVSVRRIAAPQLRQTSLLRRLFNWVLFTVWMAGAMLVSRPDDDRDRELIVLTTPPLLPPAMWLVCKVRGWEYTYVVYDLYPDYIVERGYVAEDGIVDRIWGWFGTKTSRDAKDVVALGPVMRDHIIENAGDGFDDQEVTVIHNWEDEDFIEPKSKEDNWFAKEHNLVESFTVLYSGNIGEYHDLETLVRAAAAFDDEAVRFLIIGNGDKKDDIVAMSDRLGLRGDTVRFLPYQPLEDIPYSLTAGDVSVVTVSRGLAGICVSCKLYSAMAAGQPILGITQPEDDEALVIDAFDAGIHVEQGDVQGVIEAIRTWQSSPERRSEQGEKARRGFERNFTKDQAIDSYYRLLTGKPVPDQTLDRTAETPY